MEDFTALAGRLSESVGEARGVLILSSDGLVLGAHPADAETALKPSWLRFAGLGEPVRGFVQFGTEIWCHVRRGPYAAFVVAGVGVRPGLVIDQIETALRVAEEARARREGPPSDATTIVIHEDAPPEPAPRPAPAAVQDVRRRAEPLGDPNVWGEEEGEGDGEEVDRFSLAREFSQLLQEDPGAADG